MKGTGLFLLQQSSFLLLDSYFTTATLAEKMREKLYSLVSQFQIMSYQSYGFLRKAESVYFSYTAST